MNQFSRKDFLRLSSLGLVASLLPVSEVNALSFILKLPKTSDGSILSDALLLAKEAKVKFFTKKYHEAEALYLQCIALKSDYIQFYDSLQNVYGAQGLNLKSVIMFANALQNNPNKVEFYDRTAKSLIRLELGNKKLAKTYKSNFKSNMLLADALALYEQALSIDNTKQYLIKGRNFVQHKIDFNASNIDYKKNSEYKSQKKQKAKDTKLKLKEKPIVQLEVYLSRFEDKKRNNLYFDSEIKNRKKQILIHQKKFLNYIALNYINNDKPQDAVIIYVRLFELDPTDSNTIYLLRKTLYKQKMFSEFIFYQNTFATKKNSLYSYMGLLDAVETAYNNNNYTLDNLNLANQLAENILKNRIMSQFQAIDFIEKYNKLLLLQKKYSLAFDLTEKMIKNIDVESAYYINRALYSYATILYKKGLFDNCRKVLLAGLSENLELNEEGIMKKINNLCKNKRNEKFSHKQPLYYLLYEVSMTLNDGIKSEEVLYILAQNNPNDKFVLKRI